MRIEGFGFDEGTAQLVINGPGCPASCVLTPNYRTATVVATDATLSVPGAYTISVRNGIAGAKSAGWPLTIH